VYSSKEFKYMEVANFIRRNIENDVYKVGEYIDGQREISKLLNVNRVSIKSAIELLEREGLIECIPSVGSIVKKKPNNKTLVGYIVRSLKDPFHLEMIREMDKYLMERNAGLIVVEGTSSNRLLEMGATKIIKAGQLENTLEEDTVKTIYIGSEGIPRDTVSIDNKRGMQLIYEYLSKLGHRNIVFISTAIESLVKNFDQRLNHLIDAATTDEEKKYIKKNSYFLQSYSEHEFNNVVEKIIRLNPIPTALVCSSDWIAIEIMQAVLSKGLRVPQEISITGFDNIYMSGFLNIPLTTINFPFLKVAKEIIDLLFSNDTEVKNIVCQPSLVIRNSTCEAKIDKEFIKRTTIKPRRV